MGLALLLSKRCNTRLYCRSLYAARRVSTIWKTGCCCVWCEYRFREESCEVCRKTKTPFHLVSGRAKGSGRSVRRVGQEKIYGPRVHRDQALVLSDWPQRKN